MEELVGREDRSFTARNVVLAGGVLGTVDLLLRMKQDPAGLPNLSDRRGDNVRTNSESLIGVISSQREHDLSRGVAIGSIIQLDEHSHVEPVRYSAGSGFWRLLLAPQGPARDGAHALPLPARLSVWMESQTPPRGGERWRFVLRLKRVHALQNPGLPDAELWMLERGIGAQGSVRSAELVALEKCV